MIRKIIGFTVISAFLAACSQESNHINNTPTRVTEYNLVSVSLYSGDGNFGEQTTSTIKTIVVQNSGDSVSGDISPTISGVNSSDFSVIYQNGCSSVLPTKRCTVKVTFDGRNKPPGNYSASLDFSTFLSVPLTATVPEPPPPATNSGNENFSVLISSQESKDGIDFGSFTGTQSSVKTIYIKNVGTAPTALSSAAISTTDYTLSYNQCSNKILNPNQQCMIKISFSSSGKFGGTYAANLTFDTLVTPLTALVIGPGPGGGTGPDPEISLLEGVNLALDPIDFGAMLDGQSLQKILYIKNTGTVDIASVTAALSGTNAADYTLIYNQCVNRTLKVNGSCQVRVVFDASGKSSGVYNAQLSISSLSVNYNLTAQVLSNYQLSVTKKIDAIRPTDLGDLSDGDKILCLSGCPLQKALYAEGTAVTLQYIVPVGYELVSWGGDCSASGSNSICQLTMDSDKSVEVNISLLPTPTNLSLIINNGDLYTNQSSLNLTLSANNADEMKITQNSDCSGGNWELYSTAKILPLVDLNQNEEVSFITRNSGGESVCISSSIIHDNISPQISFTLSQDQAIPVGNYNYEFSVLDSNLPTQFSIEEYSQASCGGAFVSGNSPDGNYLVSLASAETKSIKVKVTDLAGNSSELCSYNIVDEVFAQNSLTVSLVGEDSPFSTTVQDDLGKLISSSPDIYQGDYDDELVTLTAEIGETEVFLGWGNGCGLNLTCQVDMSLGSQSLDLNVAHRTKDLSTMYSQYPLKSHSIVDASIDNLWKKSVSMVTAQNQEVIIGNKAFFTGPDENNVWALWETSGTPETTYKLTSHTELWGTLMATYGGKVYFYGKTESAGMELFVFDPESGVDEANGGIPYCSSGYNPCILRDINPGSGNGIAIGPATSYLREKNINIHNGRIFFTGWEGGFESTDYRSSIWVYNPSSGINNGTSSCAGGGNPCKLVEYTDLRSWVESSNNTGPQSVSIKNGRLVYYLRNNSTIGSYITFITDGSASGSYTIYGRTVTWYNYYPVGATSSSDAPPELLDLRGDYAYVKHYGSLSVIRLSTGQLTIPFGDVTSNGLNIYMAAANEIPGDNRVLIVSGAGSPTNVQTSIRPPVKWYSFNGASMTELPIGSAFGFTSYDGIAGTFAKASPVNLDALSSADPNKWYIHVEWRTDQYTYSSASGVWQYSPNSSIVSTSNNYCSEGANPCKYFNNGNTSNPSAPATASSIQIGDYHYNYNDLRQLPITGSEMNGLRLWYKDTPSGPEYINEYPELIPNTEESMNFCVIRNGSNQLVTIYNESRVDQVLKLLQENNVADFNQDCTLISTLLENDGNYNTTFVSNGKPISGVVNTNLTGTVETYTVPVGYEVKQAFAVNGKAVAVVAKRILIYESGTHPLCVPWEDDCQINDYLGSKVISFVDNGTYTKPAPNVLDMQVSIITGGRYSQTIQVTSNKPASVIIQAKKVLTGAVVSVGPTVESTNQQVVVEPLESNTLYEIRTIGTTTDGDLYQQVFGVRTSR